jgi:DMSO/TMAO reductase YedYZ heme-binding membrane subunit
MTLLRSAETRAKPGPRLWARAWGLALVLVACGTAYFFVRQFLKDGIWRFDLTLVNKSLGTASLALIALSMLVTGVAYFGLGPARLLAWRKHLGLVGFWTGLAHGLVNHVLLRAVGLEAEQKGETLHGEAAGLVALLVFAALAVLSLDAVRRRLDARAWRKGLRYGGYAGLVLAAGHAALLKGASWGNFFRTFRPFLPSLSLIAAALAAAAVLLRIGIFVALKGRSAKTTSASPGP